MHYQFFGIVYALIAAVFWGAGDFTGGYATRRKSLFQVHFLSSLSSVILLVCLAYFNGENLPSSRNFMLALFAGIFGSIGLVAMYQGLSRGNAALVAPVAGVVGAGIPVGIGMFIQGVPSFIHIIGFLIAFLGIWVVTRFSSESNPRLNEGLGLGLLSGFGFGGYFTLISQLDGYQVFSPLVVAKITSLIFAIVGIIFTRQSIPGLKNSGVAMTSGLLEAGGNVFYLLATNYTRLDIAAVLSSLFPAVTVILSRLILHERISRLQWMGVLICLAAIILISV